MTEMGAGELVYSLRKKIQEIRSEIDALGDPVSDMPELISSANLLRSNDYLLNVNKKKSELIAVYEQYSCHLEELLSAIFEIQNELKDILKEQSALITAAETKQKSRSR